MTYKCIRCGKEAINTPQVVGVWNIPYGRDGHLFTNEHKIVALCPDCQLPKKEEVTNAYLKDVPGIFSSVWCELQTQEKCLITQEKRIAQLERTVDRLYEIIKYVGREEK